MRKYFLTLLTVLIATAYTSAQFGGGSGTATDPYIISTAAHLAGITGNYITEGYHFKQTADINLTSYNNWTPIGTTSSPFNGIYDGNNKEISNLKITGTNANRGLFAATSSTAVIKNVVLTDVSITGRNYMGSLVAYNRGVVENCSATGSVTGRTPTGGLIGKNLNSGVVSNCFANCTIEGRTSSGGLVGENEGTINTSYAKGSLTPSFESSVFGGLVGRNTSYIDQCYSNVYIDSDISEITGGGFVGSNTSTGNITNSYFRGTIETSDDPDDETIASGFVWENEGTITNCYAQGTISGGSIAGFCISNTGTITNSFWDETSFGSIGSQGGTARTTAQMQTESTFTNAGWHFTCQIWGINTHDNGKYPFLLWQEDYEFPASDCNYWTGDSGTDWGKSGNWSSGVPTAGSNVLIRKNEESVFPVLSGQLSLNITNVARGATLTISSTGHLTSTDQLCIRGQVIVEPQGKITSTGSLNNNNGFEGLVLESDEDGSATIIHNTENVPATVKRYVPGTQQFHLISTPVEGQTIANFIAENSGVLAYNSTNNVYAMRHYIETTGTWSSFYPANQAGNLVPGTTYAIGLASPGTITYKGLLTSTSKTIELVRTETSSGWNAIGNPFASGLNANEGTGGFYRKYNGQFDTQYSGLYIWVPSGTSGQYQVINGVPGLSQKYLASAQGFLVKAKIDPGTVTLESGMRAHENPTFYKSDKVEDWHIVDLMAQNSSGKVLNTAIAFNSEMTYGIDKGFDAGLYTDNVNFRFFSASQEEDNDMEFAIQALPDNFENVLIIPLGFTNNSSGVIVFSAVSNSLPQDITAWLEDRETGIFTTLSSESYSATIAANTEALGRFFLHIGRGVNEVAISTTDNLNYCQGDAIDVTFTADVDGVNYQWYKNEEPIAGATLKTYHATEEGSYSVMVSVGGSHAESNPEVIVVNALPTISLPEDIAVCYGESVTLTATGDADVFEWNNGVVNGAEFIPEQTTSYILTAVNTATGCEATAEVTVTVNPLPTIEVPDNFAVCHGEPVALTATGNADVFEWNNGVVNGEEFIPEQTATYIATATYTATGWETTAEITVTVNPLPTIEVPDNFAVCHGEPVTLTATGNADVFDWNNGVVNGEEFIPEQTATYIATATYTATGCETTAEVTVTVNPLPEFILANDDINITVAEEYLFDAGEGFAEYLWFDGSTNQTYLFVGSEWGLGTFDVWAEVTNEFGCSTRDSAVVNVGPTGIDTHTSWILNLYPNPTNGDININISGLSSQRVSVTIHNAVGQTIFHNYFNTSDGNIQETIRLKDRSKGVYLITIGDGKNKVTRRIVIN